MKKRIFTAALIFGFLAALAAGAEDGVSEDALLQRQDVLLEQMAQLDADAPDYQTQLRSIGAELRRIQDELQTMDRAAAGKGFGNSAGAGSAAAQNSGAAAGIFGSPAAAQDGGTAPFSPFDGMDLATMRRTRADLTAQLKYLNRTLETLGPQDEALAASLGEQQQELTGRIKELDARIGSPAQENAISGVSAAAEPQADPAAADTPAAEPAAALPGAGQESLIPGSGSASGRGAVSALPTEVDGAWYSSENKNQMILDAIGELQKSNEAVNKRLDEVMEELKTIETQLKLLSRQAVIDK